MGARMDNTSMRPIVLMGFAPDLWEGMSIQRLDPREGVLFTVPARPVGLVGSMRGLGERGHGRSAIVLHRDPVHCQSPRGCRTHAPRLGQCHLRIAAQTDVAPPAANGYTLHPILAASLAYEEMQAIAVRVADWVPESPHLVADSFMPSKPPHLLHNYGGITRD